LRFAGDSPPATFPQGIKNVVLLAPFSLRSLSLFAIPGYAGVADDAGAHRRAAARSTDGKRAHTRQMILFAALSALDTLA
jgi:hypothetical protein